MFVGVEAAWWGDETRNNQRSGQPITDNRADLDPETNEAWAISPRAQSREVAFHRMSDRPTWRQI
jgi:hypothetical protein